MKRYLLFGLLVGCGPKTGAEVCVRIELGVDVTTLPDREPNAQFCWRDQAGGVGPADAAHCCVRARDGGTGCGMSCEPKITVEQVGPVFEPTYRDSSACCVYVQEGKVIAHSVKTD